jgi:uncharacterized membrane protein YjgN (DUF898 family)
MEWFYKDGDQEIGPISQEKLQELINAKRVTRDTLARNTKMDEWQQLSIFMKPKSQSSTNQPPSPESPQTTTPLEPSQASSPEIADSQQPATKPPASLETEVPFEFKGSGREYFKIWIVNVLLSIITLGIYSAWAKVRRKQYFYGNTSVMGAAFRYLADPKKILKGRIIVFLGFLMYSLVNQFVPKFGIVLSLALVCVFPWLIVRSMAFNARNSSWRNIRFNFEGTYGDAAKAFILWPLLIIFTLGIIMPYIYYKQKKFIVENSAYGTTPFIFNAEPKDYYTIALKFIGILIVAGIIASIASVGITVAISLFNPTVASKPEVISIITFIFFLFIYLFGFIYLSVESSNLLYNSSRLSKHHFKATMKVIKYGFIVLTNTLATVLTLGFFHPFAMVRAYRYKIQHLALLPEGDVDQFIAAELKETSALGDEMSDFMDFDFGL